MNSCDPSVGDVSIVEFPIDDGIFGCGHCLGGVWFSGMGQEESIIEFPLERRKRGGWAENAANLPTITEEVAADLLPTQDRHSSCLSAGEFPINRKSCDNSGLCLRDISFPEMEPEKSIVEFPLKHRIRGGWMETAANLPTITEEVAADLLPANTRSCHSAEKDSVDEFPIDCRICDNS